MLKPVAVKLKTNWLKFLGTCRPIMLVLKYYRASVIQEDLIRHHSCFLNFFAIVWTLKVFRYLDRCRGGAWTRAVRPAAASSDVAPALWVFASANRDLTLDRCRFCSKWRRLDRIMERLTVAILCSDLRMAFWRLRRALIARVSLQSLPNSALVAEAASS